MTGRPLPRWVITVPAAASLTLLAVMLAAALPDAAHLALIAVQAVLLAQSVALWRHTRATRQRPGARPFEGVPVR